MPEERIKTVNSLYVEGDFEAAFAEALTGADQGCSYCAFIVGTCYLRGQGVKLNRVLGATWLYRATEGDRPSKEACTAVASGILSGKLINTDHLQLRKEALDDIAKGYFYKAIELGSSSAAFKLLNWLLQMPQTQSVKAAGLHACAHIENHLRDCDDMTVLVTGGCPAVGDL